MLANNRFITKIVEYHVARSASLLAILTRFFVPLLFMISSEIKDKKTFIRYIYAFHDPEVIALDLNKAVIKTKRKPLIIMCWLYFYINSLARNMMESRIDFEKAACPWKTMQLLNNIPPRRHQNLLLVRL